MSPASDRIWSTSICWPCFRVPKELISRFVKICPTCQVRRRGLRPRPSGPQKRSGHRSSKTKKSSSPPTSRRGSALNSQTPSQVSQAEYLGQLDGHHDWMDSQQNVHERQGINQGSVETLSHFPNSISATLDPFGGDMAMSPSQLNYGVGYASGILKSWKLLSILLVSCFFFFLLFGRWSSCPPSIFQRFHDI